MKIVSFTLSDSPAPRLGALVGADQVLDFFHSEAGVPEPRDYVDAFDLDGSTLTEARSLLATVEDDPGRLAHLKEAGAVVPRSDLRLLAPVPRPRKVLCIGLNYKDHAAESKMDIPERPLLFSKFSSCVVGPGAPVELPPDSEKIDYEAELGVVIGRRARKVPEERGFDHVLGYVNFNDVSARDFQFADGQWQRGKSCDTFAPFGPYLATTDEIRDPHRLRIRFRLNGETLQDSNTDQLIFGIPALIAHLSRAFTLEPGDVIATGTPPGVGFARKPPIWVKAGDKMEVEIEGLGVLENPVRG